MACKITWHFRLVDRGWTEVFYHAGTNPIDLASYDSNEEIISARMAFSPPNVELEAISATRVDGTKGFYSERIQVGGRRRSKELGVGLDPEYVETAYRVKFLVLGGAAYRKLWLRGISRQDLYWDKNAETVTSTGELDEKVKLFINQVVARQYCIQRRKGVTEGAPKLYFSQLGKSTVASRAVIHLDGDIIPAVGDYLTVHGLDPADVPFMPKKVRVVDRNTETGEIGVDVVWPTGQSDLAVAGDVYVRQVLYAYEQITNGLYDSISDHDTGRPTMLPAGKQKTQQRRRSGRAVALSAT